jgi:dimethylhistidine N-methyltransferase
MTSKTSPELTQFAEDVLRGLSSTPKQLSSRYFYDDEGSRLFMEIMKLPEYYPTRAEMKIFTDQKEAICDAFTEPGPTERGLQSAPLPIDLIELGAGDGLKTAVLIEHLLSTGVDFQYEPIDISREANDALEARFRTKFPDLRIDPHTGDYFQILGSLQKDNGRRKVILFLGSNIGNFLRDQAVKFFRSLREVMNENDRLFIGFDMQKDPRTIVAAYDDKQGITSAFNLNLLARINRELGGDFDLEKF